MVGVLIFETAKVDVLGSPRVSQGIEGKPLLLGSSKTDPEELVSLEPWSEMARTLLTPQQRVVERPNPHQCR